jgi:DNA excision repair protein ERCC-2
MSVGSGVEARLFFAHEQIRNPQKEMISDGIIALREGGFLLAAAPTGIGKTAAALASAFEVVNFYNTNPEVPKILFMTGRQSQHRIVVDTVRQINSKLPSGNPRIKLVDIIGREGMCEVVDKSTGQCSCEKDVVESARRARRVDLGEFILEAPRHVDQVIKEGRARRICAWATARSAVRDAHILVCDYNHVFIEGVRENSLPIMGVSLENAILIVDEAHNLPDRIRSGLERRVTKNVFQRALVDINEHKGNLENGAKQLELSDSKSLDEAILLEKQVKALKDDSGLNNWFAGKITEIESSQKDDLRVETSEFLDAIASAIDGIEEDELEDGISRIRRMNRRLLSVVIDGDDSIEEDEQNDCIRLAEILEICIKYRDSPALALVFDRLNNDIPRVTSHLLDPSVVGRPIFEQCAGSILMSGTLFPPNMYSDILGIPEEKSACREYESGFPPENRPILIASDVTSKFTERDASYSSIRDHIQSVLEKTKGNVAVFAPSYAMLDRIGNDVSYTFGKVSMKEGRRMSKKEVERTIARLYEMRAMGRESVLFGVLSGKLSEGIDYSENILNAVVCVGLPLPPPSARQDALLEYYTRRFGRSKAWKYASLQPAVNSVLQALGRPIRNAEDKAIVVLLEKRLLERRVGDCMPKSMHTRQTTSPSRTSKHVERFFEMK